MSVGEVESDGMHYIWHQLVAKPAAESYRRIAGGSCIACNQPQQASDLTLTIRADTVILSHQCTKCGHINELMRATPAFVKCEPSSSPAST